MTRLTVLHDAWKYRDEQQAAYEIRKEALKEERDETYRKLWRHEMECTVCRNRIGRERECEVGDFLRAERRRTIQAVRDHCEQGANFMFDQLNKAGIRFPSHGLGYDRMGELLKDA